MISEEFETGDLDLDLQGQISPETSKKCFYFFEFICLEFYLQTSTVY